MSKVYSRLFNHIVWATKYREKCITERIEKYLIEWFKVKAGKYNYIFHEANSYMDHVHLAVTIKPADSISEIVGKIKGSSSHYLNKELQITRDFSWQDGFSVHSISESALPKIMEYIRNQKDHHSKGKIVEEYERIENEK